jgi:hypothetical protein
MNRVNDPPIPIPQAVAGMVGKLLILLFGAVGPAADAAIFSMTRCAVLRGKIFNAFRAAFEYSIENIICVNILLTHQQTFYLVERHPLHLEEKRDITMSVLTFTTFSIKVTLLFLITR